MDFSERLRLFCSKLRRNIIVRRLGGDMPAVHWGQNGHLRHFQFRIVRGTDNEIILGKNCSLKNCTVWFQGSHNRLILGDDCQLDGTVFMFTGDNGTIRLGNHVWIHADVLSATSLHIADGCTLSVGDDCVFSNNVTVFSTDYHGMYDGDSLLRLNPDKDTVIGRHVILFMNTSILKGARIADGCAVGTMSLVSGVFSEPNCVLAGNPAKVVRRNVIWDYQKMAQLTDNKNDFRTK